MWYRCGRTLNHRSNERHTLRQRPQPQQLTNGGTNERRRVADVVETFLLDEVGDGRGEVQVVGLHIVLQYQTAQRASGLV